MLGRWLLRAWASPVALLPWPPRAVWQRPRAPLLEWPQVLAAAGRQPAVLGPLRAAPLLLVVLSLPLARILLLVWVVRPGLLAVPLLPVLPLRAQAPQGPLQRTRTLRERPVRTEGLAPPVVPASPANLGFLVGQVPTGPPA